MKRLFTLICLCFAWICANGAIWDAVQVVAWGKMFASNVRVGTVSEALRETFGGEKPCAICRAVSKAKQADEQSAPSPQRDSGKGKIDLALAELPARVAPPERVEWPALAASKCDARTEPVPLRPPRV